MLPATWQHALSVAVLGLACHFLDKLLPSLHAGVTNWQHWPAICHVFLLKLLKAKKKVSGPSTTAMDADIICLQQLFFGHFWIVISNLNFRFTSQALFLNYNLERCLWNEKRERKEKWQMKTYEHIPHSMVHHRPCLLSVPHTLWREKCSCVRPNVDWEWNYCRGAGLPHYDLSVSYTSLPSLYYLSSTLAAAPTIFAPKQVVH